MYITKGRYEQYNGIYTKMVISTAPSDATYNRNVMTSMILKLPIQEISNTFYPVSMMSNLAETLLLSRTKSAQQLTVVLVVFLLK